MRRRRRGRNPGYGSYKVVRARTAKALLLGRMWPPEDATLAYSHKTHRLGLLRGRPAHAEAKHGVINICACSATVI